MKILKYIIIGTSFLGLILIPFQLIADYSDYPFIGVLKPLLIIMTLYLIYISIIFLYFRKSEALNNKKIIELENQIVETQKNIEIEKLKAEIAKIHGKK